MLRKYSLEDFLWFAATILLLIVYTGNLFVPLTGDAGKYAAISRNIVQSGDWINLTVHHTAYDQKPQFLFWMSAAFFELFGMSPAIFKLPVLLFSFFGFYSTYRLGKLLYGERAGRLAALMLASSEMFLLFTNDIHMDALMASACAFALWQLMGFFRSKKKINLLLGLIGVGLSVFAKGPVGLTVPVFAVGSHLLLTRQYRELFHPRWLLAIPIVGLFFLPTIIGIYRQLGYDGLRFYFIENNVGRMSGTYKGNGTDPFFYLHTSLYILLPWSFVALTALFAEIGTHLKKGAGQTNGREFVTVGGIVLYGLVISVSSAKAPHYMMIITPLIFILAAQWLVRVWSGTDFPRLAKWLGGLQYGTAGLLILLSFVFALWLFPSGNLWYWLFAAICLMLLVFSLRIKDRMTGLLLTSVFSMVLLQGTINFVVFPGEFAYHSTIPACKIFNEKADDRAVLHTYRSIHRELFYYAKKPGLYLNTEDELANVVRDPDVWVYTDDEGLAAMKRWGVSFGEYYSFKHHALTRQSLKFLNPATREKSLVNMYLVKVQ